MRSRRAFLWTAAWVAVGVVAAAPAMAVRGHGFLRAFPSGSEPSLSLTAGDRGSGVASAASGVAVSGVSGEVFVADTGNRRVDVFASTGAFLRAWGWGVADGAAELQVCTSECKPGLSGAEPGEFERPVFVAVDEDSSSASFGDVYVADVGDELVSKFDAEGHLIASWGNNGENASHERVEPNGQLNGETTPERVPFSAGAAEPIAGIGTDGSGNLWALGVNEKLFEFDQAGSFLAECFVTGTVNPQGIAVGTSGIYSVHAFGSTQRVGFGQCAHPVLVTTTERPASGLAVDVSNEDLYVDGAGSLVEDLPASCVASSATVCQPINVFGESGEGGVLHEGAGVAIDPSSGTVYVANVGSQQVFAYGVVVEVESAAATGVAAHSAVLHGLVNPEGTGLSRCEFEYGTTEAYGSVVPCEPDVGAIGSGSAPVGVQAKVDGLFGGAQYHFRLRAANAKAGTHGEAEAFSTAPTAQVIGVSATQSGSTALLEGVINPGGAEAGEAKYHFEVGECASLAACPESAYPIVLGGLSLAAGSSNRRVFQTVEGLTAGRIYHYRLVVEDANGPTYPEQQGTMEGTFVSTPAGPTCSRERPQPGSEGLSDCRAYEMVTPTSKNGGYLQSGSFLISAAVSSDGSRVLATSVQCFDESPSCIGVRQTTGAPFAFERGPEGWTPRPLALSATAFPASTLITYRADSGLVLYAAPPSEGAVEQFYVRLLDGSLETLGPLGETPGYTAKQVVARTWMGTEDFSHIVFEAQHLWSFDETENADGVYEYPGVEGHPVLVDVTGPEKASRSLVSACGAGLGGPTPIDNKVGAVSADGRSVVFAALPCSTGTGTNAGVPVPAETVYERIELVGGLMESVLVSGRAGGGACSSKACASSPAGNAAFSGGSVDGSRVSFLSTQQLTDEASEDARKGDTAGDITCPLTASDASGCNLYLWECPAYCEGGGGEARLTDVSGGDVSGRGPQVQGVVAVSRDGTDVFFVARGVLAGANGRGVAPSPGGENLYVYGPDGEGHDRTVFVATLSEADKAMWESVALANISPDGRFLVFSSHRALTGDVARLEGPAQVYRYDAHSGELLRVSVGQEGFGDNGNAGSGDAAIVPAGNSLQTGGRSDPTMSDDGRFVSFESPVALTPGALNDVSVEGNSGVLAENVYEWEAFGARVSEGSSACAQPGGCVWLISDGRDVHEGSHSHGNESAVQLMGMDSSGRDVFFETADQLVAGDTDSQVDVYDARADGGFPARLEGPSCVSLVECHGSVVPEAPVFGGAGSGVFSGFGNVLPGTEEPKPVGNSRPRLTPRQLLERALARCRRKHGDGRRGCERAARRAYRARLLARALASCRRKHGRARTVCDRRAVSRYGRRRK